MDFFEVANSTPTMRRFLERPIAEPELVKILETANMAPSGSNAQPWEFVVVRDLQTRREIQRLYEAVWGPYKDTAIIRGRTTLSPRAVKALATGDEFAAQLAVVPVHVVVFLDRPKMRVERGSADASASGIAISNPPEVCGSKLSSAIWSETSSEIRTLGA